MESMTLYELNGMVRETLEDSLPDEVWVQAELSEVRVASNGHCYVEFVQKDARGNNLIAKARGIIWRQEWNMLQPYFQRVTGQVFTSGLKVLVQVSVTFHELFGYSLTVHDIDPTYTLGDLARRRQEILARLDEEGVLTLNKELPFPMLPLRIAVISSASAAGYGDFCDQLMRNGAAFAFRTQLFPAVMQGEQVESSLIAALNCIAAEMDDWDAVVIIRGGGSTSDLLGFDTYALANNCAQFPLPIITGIGHERDDTVIDMVAHTRVKTPTAAAEFLIDHVQQAADRLEACVEQLEQSVRRNMEAATSRLALLAGKLPSLFTAYRFAEERRLDARLQRIQYASANRLNGQMRKVDDDMGRIGRASERFMEAERHKVMMLSQQILSADPALVLQRGYSYTVKDGKVLRDAAQLHSGEEVVTHLSAGSFTSVVK
jgi:exodeoxyribonuclease VII large subunit